MAVQSESELYPPIKAFLEDQGYEVKAEVESCDLVARRDSEPPVIVEMKRRFSLDLVLQGVARRNLSERVYLAVAAGSAFARCACFATSSASLTMTWPTRWYASTMRASWTTLSSS